MIIETIKLHEMGVFPEFFLGIGVIYLVMHGLFVSFNSANKFPLVQSSIISLSVLFLIMVCFLLFNDSLNNLNYVSFCNTISNDYLSFSAKMAVGVASIICLLLIQQYLITQQINSFEYVIILLFAILGLFLLCSANDLITAYLAIELQSLSFYVLAAFKKNSTYSVESGLKYFILGAFSSGLFLFGSSLIYGVTGSVNFEVLKDLVMFEGNSIYAKEFVINKLYSLNYLCKEIVTEILNLPNKSTTIIPNLFDGLKISYGAHSSLVTSDFLIQVLNGFSLGTGCISMTFENTIGYNNLILVGLLFIFVSLFFKLALAPFHLWSPDVYEGSPSSSTLFFAIVPKISIFVLLLRLSYFTFPTFVEMWEEYVTVIAVGSVIVGSVVGLEQRKFKSLLAYSSISHMGYLLISFSTGTMEGFQMLFCYLIIYMGSSLCIWSVFMLTRLKTIYNKKQNKDLGDFVLLRKSNCMLSIILTTALFSIAGLPPMVGFMVKLSIFLVAIEKSLYTVALISIVFSVISTFFYLRVVKVLFFEPVLVGRLYYPIKTQKSIIAAIFFYLFIYLFINPSILYLLSNKVSLLFI